MTKDDEKFMRLAIEQARIAGRMGEVPIGAVMIDSEGKLLSSGYNLRESENDPTAHAEIIAIRKAGEALGSWRLEGSALYVTIEPCLMCMGAIILARIKRLVFGSRDPKAGTVLSVYEIGSDRRLNHTVEVTEGVCAEECSALLKDFFRILRK
ncbi:MAG TPA: tRNA adenosine(34) deaminase TadA [Thermodesulfobacteriota bacterium]|nr:tRNA adenosine(34) deaminase TadA [Thermodesulfobacteriota bacterium]